MGLPEPDKSLGSPDGVKLMMLSFGGSQRSAEIQAADASEGMRGIGGGAVDRFGDESQLTECVLERKVLQHISVIVPANNCDNPDLFHKITMTSIRIFLLQNSQWILRFTASILKYSFVL